VLVGIPDHENPNSISPEVIRDWEAEGVVEWWGLRNDMPSVLQSSNVVVLPSYREGLPKILLEAAACGRPIVATDVPGCREIVSDGDSGLLVPPRDVNALAEAIRRLLGDRALRTRMGERGRAIAESGFSEDRTITATLAVYRELLDADHEVAAVSERRLREH
jgi:glycosyltransferase involved in cell wall biosynthesis